MKAALVLALLVASGVSAQDDEERMVTFAHYLNLAAKDLGVTEPVVAYLSNRPIPSSAGYLAGAWVQAHEFGELRLRGFAVGIARGDLRGASDRELYRLAYHEVCHMAFEADAILAERPVPKEQALAWERRARDCEAKWMAVKAKETRAARRRMAQAP